MDKTPPGAALLPTCGAASCDRMQRQPFGPPSSNPVSHKYPYQTLMINFVGDELVLPTHDNLARLAA